MPFSSTADFITLLHYYFIALFPTLLLKNIQQRFPSESLFWRKSIDSSGKWASKDNGILYEIWVSIARTSVYDNNRAAKDNLRAWEVWMEKDMNLEMYLGRSSLRLSYQRRSWSLFTKWSSIILLKVWLLPLLSKI